MCKNSLTWRDGSSCIYVCICVGFPVPVVPLFTYRHHPHVSLFAGLFTPHYTRLPLFTNPSCDHRICFQGLLLHTCIVCHIMFASVFNVLEFCSLVSVTGVSDNFFRVETAMQDGWAWKELSACHFTPACQWSEWSELRQTATYSSPANDHSDQLWSELNQMIATDWSPFDCLIVTSMRVLYEPSDKSTCDCKLSWTFWELFWGWFQ